jgi:Cu(I)/Ag(I) efflux system protein CusF
MKEVKCAFVSILLGVSVVVSSPAISQINEMTNGVVRKIDLENSKITIKHEEIKNLDMPPMTMVFQVRNKALIDKVKVGETVKFTVVQEGGKLVVTDLQPAP